MEIKATLPKPYTEEARIEFIVEQNHNKGYEIRETINYLQAWGFDDDELLEQKKEQVRGVRSEYYDKYVDWYQSKPLLWAEMTEEEKTNIANYRLYLKDYTSGEEWWLKNPKTFEEWLNDQTEVTNE